MPFIWGIGSSYSLHPSGPCWPVASGPLSGPVRVAVPTDRAARGPRTRPHEPEADSGVARSHHSALPRRRIAFRALANLMQDDL